MVVAAAAIPTVQEEAATRQPNLFAVWLQKTMDDYQVPWLIQLFLCWVYNRYGFAANGLDEQGRWVNLEEMGVFDHEADAYWASNQVGGCYVEVPRNRLEPRETVNYGNLTCPQSPHQHIYRENRRLNADVVFTREQVDRLVAKIQATDEIVAQLR